jgi:hypothetical protein
MKIRIKDNSVRYRLTKTEVKQLAETGSIFAETNFVEAKLTYSLVAKDDLLELDASFINNTICLYIPKTTAEKWYSNDVITYKNDVVLPNGITLKLLLEKDFVCLDHTDEDQSDNYENPNKTC